MPFRAERNHLMNSPYFLKGRESSLDREGKKLQYTARGKSIWPVTTNFPNNDKNNLDSQVGNLFQTIFIPD